MSNHSESNWSANSCALSAQLSKSSQAPPCKKSAPTGSLGRLSGDAACSEVGATLQGPVLLDCRLHLQTSKEVLHSASIWFHANFKSEYIDVLQSTKNCKGESGQREKMDKILSQTCGWAHSKCIDMIFNGRNVKQKNRLLLLVLLHHANAFLHGSHWTTTTREEGFQRSRRFLCQLFFNILFGSLSCGTSNLTFQSCHLKSGIYHSHLLEHKGCLNKNTNLLWGHTWSHIVTHVHMRCRRPVAFYVETFCRFLLSMAVLRSKRFFWTNFIPVSPVFCRLLSNQGGRINSYPVKYLASWDRANLIPMSVNIVGYQDIWNLRTIMN